MCVQINKFLELLYAIKYLSKVKFKNKLKMVLLNFRHVPVYYIHFHIIFIFFFSIYL